jgi:hypothetical protein
MEDQVSSHQLHLSKRLYQSLHTLFEAFFFGDSRSNSRTRGCSLLGIQLFPHQARELDDMTNDALLHKLIESAIDPEHRHAHGARVPDSCCEFPVASGRWWSPQMKDKPSSGHNLSFEPLAKALRRRRRCRNSGRDAHRAAATSRREKTGSQNKSLHQGRRHRFQAQGRPEHVYTGHGTLTVQRHTEQSGGTLLTEQNQSSIPFSGRDGDTGDGE